MDLVDFYDLILVPPYILLFIYIINIIRKKYYPDSPYGKFLLYGFIAKIAGCLLFGLLFNFYFKEGDSYTYFTGGIDFKETIFKNFPKNLHFLYDPSEEFGKYYILNYDKTYNFGYLSAPSNLMAAKFVAFFSLFAFNRYLLISLCFGAFSFSGMWVTFKVFCDNFPSIKRQLSIGFLFLPTLLFWGSGIAKDPLCIGFLGWMFYSGYWLFIKKKWRFSLLLIFILAIYLLAIVKIYILLSFMPFFILWVVLHSFKQLSGPLVRMTILIGLLVGFMIFSSTSLALDYIQTFTQYIDGTKHIYEQITSDDGSLINGGELDLTRQGLINKIPSSMATTLFRPFLWESKKFLTFLSALESSFIMLYTIYTIFQTGILRFFKIILQNTIVLFSFFFSIVFAAFVGLTCFNFGTLVRYKIPCIPFYLAALMIIVGISREQKKNKSFIEIKKES